MSFYSLYICCNSVVTSSTTEAGSSQFSVWVAFYEIYNECVFDLLQSSLCTRSKKRPVLRVCDDGAGNAYVKGVSFFSTWFRCSCGTSLMHSNCYICLQTWGGLTSWTWVKPSRYCNMETKIEVLLPRRWTSPQAEGKPWNNNYHPIFHFCNWYACFVYSHSIFTMKLLKIESDAVKSISE